MSTRLLSIILLCLLPSLVAADTLRHVRIETAAAPGVARALQDTGYDVLEGSVGADAFELVVSRAELDALVAAGHSVELLAVGRPFRELQAGGGVPAGYPDLTTIVSTMSVTALAFPSICQFVDLTVDLGVPATFENRHLHAVKISDNVAVDEDEPAVLIVSAHHCRELVTPVIGLDIIGRLTTGYGTDPTITALVDSHEIWIAPAWNPDGYEYVFDADNLWRKNRRTFPEGIGVDLNRNYPWGWDNPCSGDNTANSNTYKGPAPASEPETQTLIALTEREDFAKVVDYHSFGTEVLHGYACWTHPFDNYFENKAIDLSTVVGYQGDHRAPGADGEHFEWQLGARGAFAFLIETADEFQPTYASAVAEANALWPGTVWMLERPIPLSGHVTDSMTGDPVEAAITFDVAFPNGEVYASRGPFGRYHAALPSGVYGVTFDAEGYESLTLANVVVDGEVGTLLDVTLDPVTTSVADASPVGSERLLLGVSPLARTVHYRLASPDHVNLRIYDVRGAAVRSLLDGRVDAGAHSVTWDGNDERGRQLASGQYFFRIQTSARSARGKLILMR